MRSILNRNIIWRKAQKAGKRQRACGLISGICLALALLALFDGLLAEMRAGTNELELLPGQSIILSGPVPLKHPIDSDVIARFTPATDALAFDLEGFFTGYWFGAGMWRGGVIAGDTVEPGEYRLKISFRGAPAQSAQRYIVNVFADARAKREAAKSYFRRYLDINPFILSALTGSIGVAFGCITYFYGRRYAINLAALGMAEVYRTGQDGRCWCLCARHDGLKPGGSRIVLDKTGMQIGQARIEDWQKGKVVLSTLDGRAVLPGSLVCLGPLPGDAEENRQNPANGPAVG